MGQLLERPGGRGDFLDECGVLLGDLIHLRYRCIDLSDARALLDGRGGDFGHDVGDAFDGGDDLVHGFAGVIGEFTTRVRAFDRIDDEGFDLFGCAGGPLGQTAHFAGHDGEAAALFARACGFDRGVEG